MTNKGAENLGIFLGGVLFMALVMAFSNATPSDPCIRQNCDVRKAQGSQYCEFHRQYFDTEYIKDHPLPTRAPSASTSYSYTAEPTRRSTPTPTRAQSGGYRNSSGSRSTGAAVGSRTNNYPVNDPADYDDPEEYADDAWGEDFDDWDEAYDYWEDY